MLRLPSTRRTLRTFLGALLLIAPALAGCSPDVGECDMAAATTVVYDDNGIPAFAGQAQVQASCGNGAFCHSAQASGTDRLGAPHGLDFDMAVVVGEGPEPEFTERLRAGRARVEERIDDVFGTVEAGTMPPFGESTLVAHAGAPRYAFEDGRRLPPIDLPAGYEIFRNWLACGAPVVERTTPRPDGVAPVGEIVEPRSVEIEPTFTSIYDAYLGPSCGLTCHGPANAGQLALSNLDLSTRDGALAALVNRDAAGRDCAGSGLVLVAPNEPDDSLLLQKLVPPAGLCGDPMPIGATPPPNVVEAVRGWIMDGAEDN